MKRAALSAALSLVLCGLAACGAVPPGTLETELPAEFRECRPETYAALSEMGIPRSEVTSFFNVPERRTMRTVDGESTDQIVGYSNWLRLQRCDGSVVFVFNRACQLRRSFGRGECALPG